MYAARVTKLEQECAAVVAIRAHLKNIAKLDLASEKFAVERGVPGGCGRSATPAPLLKSGSEVAKEMENALVKRTVRIWIANNDLVQAPTTTSGNGRLGRPGRLAAVAAALETALEFALVPAFGKELVFPVIPLNKKPVLRWTVQTGPELVAEPCQLLSQKSIEDISLDTRVSVKHVSSCVI